MDNKRFVNALHVDDDQCPIYILRHENTALYPISSESKIILRYIAHNIITIFNSGNASAREKA